jgi:hypothetical protein
MMEATEETLLANRYCFEDSAVAVDPISGKRPHKLCYGINGG